jgi:hypothetical protein
MSERPLKCSFCRYVIDPEYGDSGGRVIAQGGYYLCGACVAGLDAVKPGCFAKYEAKRRAAQPK